MIGRYGGVAGVALVASHFVRSLSSLLLLLLSKSPPRPLPSVTESRQQFRSDRSFRLRVCVCIRSGMALRRRGTNERLGVVGGMCVTVRIALRCACRFACVGSTSACVAHVRDPPSYIRSDRHRHRHRRSATFGDDGEISDVAVCLCARARSCFFPIYIYA